MLVTSLLRTMLTRSFKPFVFSAVSDQEAAFIPGYKDEREFGLYVHIPFCRTLCPFCPYCKVRYDGELAQKYEQALLGEIELLSRGLLNSDGIIEKKKVTSLYFGGGSPALMASYLGPIIESLKKSFIITQGIGVELHPADITSDMLRLLKDSGVTMVSIGIQSFDKNCLAALGRKETDYAKLFSDVRAAGFEVVDVDLIFAIPGQTTETLKGDIERAFKAGATQISTYPFIDFTYATNMKKPLKERRKKKMLFDISAYCRKSGKSRTSVWTFAKQNTHKYSSITRDSFLGFGVSATSLLKKQFKINTFSIEEYCKRIQKGLLPSSLKVAFTLRQRIVYYLFWSAYGMNIDSSKFELFFEQKLEKLYGFEIKICILLGLVTRRKVKDEKHRFHTIYRLTDKGAYYYHFIEQQYTTAYIDKMWNISRLVPWPKKIVLW